LKWFEYFKLLSEKLSTHWKEKNKQVINNEISGENKILNKEKNKALLTIIKFY